MAMGTDMAIVQRKKKHILMEEVMAKHKMVEVMGMVMLRMVEAMGMVMLKVEEAMVTPMEVEAMVMITMMTTLTLT
jgi:hypothetical protein